MLPRLYREAPLNSIWEGSGNINALDVLRIIVKAPETLEAFRAELAPALAHLPLRRHFERLHDLASRRGADVERSAREFVEGLALLWQAALLSQYAPSEVSEAFVASRIEGNWGRAFGTLPSGVAFERIIERARPQV